MVESSHGGELTYQWEESTDDGISWAEIDNETSSTYEKESVSLNDNGSRFRVIVYKTIQGVTTSSVSNSATLSVLGVEAPTISSITKFPTVSVSVGGLAEFTISATSPDQGILSYQWQYKDQNGDWTNISGATNNPLSVTNVTIGLHNRYYRCVVTNTKNGMSKTATSLGLSLLVELPKATITAQPQNVSTPAGTNATFAIGALLPEGGTALNYSWVRHHGTNYIPIGGNSNTVTISNVTVDMSGDEILCSIECVGNGIKSTINSNPAILTVTQTAD